MSVQCKVAFEVYDVTSDLCESCEDLKKSLLKALKAINFLT